MCQVTRRRTIQTWKWQEIGSPEHSPHQLLVTNTICTDGARSTRTLQHPESWKTEKRDKCRHTPEKQKFRCIVRSSEEHQGSQSHKDLRHDGQICSDISWYSQSCQGQQIQLLTFVVVLSDYASPLWLHSDLHPTSAWPSEDTFGEALSVTSSITTPAARQQVRPLSLATAALCSFDTLRSFSCSSLIASLKACRVYGCQNLTNHTMFLQVAAQQIDIIDGEFLYHCLVFTCSTPHLPTTASPLSSIEV